MHSPINVRLLKGFVQQFSGAGNGGDNEEASSSSGVEMTALIFYLRHSDSGPLTVYEQLLKSMEIAELFILLLPIASKEESSLERVL